MPAGTQAPAAAPANAPARVDACRSVPAIESWAAKRRLDPLLVRAIVFTQSNFDDCAAAKVCRAGFDDPSCFMPGPGEDAGYSIGFDEMHDPDGRCAIANAPAGQQPAEWRRLATGLMQTLEPPYTFWPAAYHPDGVDGPYYEILERSGMACSLDLSEARGCNPRFNPFNREDSLCLGTSKLERMQRAARAWVASHRSLLGLGANSTREEERLTAYVLGNIYSGLWYSRDRSAEHPRCSSSTSNGDCWAYGFAQSASVTDAYCSSGEGGGDPARCSEGKPVRAPPSQCNGYSDIVSYVNDCELPYLTWGRDYGAVLLKAYSDLKSRCGRK